MIVIGVAMVNAFKSRFHNKQVKVGERIDYT